MNSSSAESGSMSDYELNESPPPVVIDVDPLRMIPYGGKEPIAFDREKLGLLQNQSIPVKALFIHDRKQEVPIPLPLQLLEEYKEGDWTAFFDRGVDGHRRDWTFKHRKYCKPFRSKKHVKEFLQSNGPATGMFKGEELQKEENAGPYCHGSIGTSKSTTRSKAANYAREKDSVAPGPSTKPYLPHGFV